MSTIMEIKNLQDVILYHFQVTKRSNVSFAELWKTCEAAAPNMEPPVQTPEDGKSKQFVRAMMNAVGELEKMNLVRRQNYSETSDRMEKLWLTEFGKNHVAGIVYSHQSRMGNSSAPRRSRPYAKSELNSTHNRFPQRRW